MFTIEDLIKAQMAQLEADKQLDIANRVKAETDRKLADISAFFASLTRFGVFYEANAEYFLQKTTETSVQLIPRNALPTAPLAPAPEPTQEG